MYNIKITLAVVAVVDGCRLGTKKGKHDVGIMNFTEKRTKILIVRCTYLV